MAVAWLTETDPIMPISRTWQGGAAIYRSGGLKPMLRFAKQSDMGKHPNIPAFTLSSDSTLRAVSGASSVLGCFRHKTWCSLRFRSLMRQTGRGAIN